MEFVAAPVWQRKGGVAFADTRQGRRQIREAMGDEMNHLARGFWAAPTDELVEPYVQRYFTDVPAMAGWVGQDALARVAAFAFPQVHTEPTARASAAALARTDLAPAVRRALVDADSELHEVLASRAAHYPQG